MGPASVLPPSLPLRQKKERPLGTFPGAARPSGTPPFYLLGSSVYLLAPHSALQVLHLRDGQESAKHSLTDNGDEDEDDISCPSSTSHDVLDFAGPILIGSANTDIFEGGLWDAALKLTFFKDPNAFSPHLSKIPPKPPRVISIVTG